MSEKEWMTVTELASYLSTSRSTIFNLLREDAIPHSRIGKRRLLFKKADVDAYLEAHRVPAKKPAKPTKK